MDFTTFVEDCSGIVDLRAVVDDGEFGIVLNLKTGKAYVVRGLNFLAVRDAMISDGCSVNSTHDDEYLFCVNEFTKIV